MTDISYYRGGSPDDYIESYPDILMDENPKDGCAVMTQEDFDRLSDYSHSRPTGVVVGKVWREGNGDTFGMYRDYDPPENKYVQTLLLPIEVVA